MIGAHIFMMHYRNNGLGGQINMQNNMRTVYVGIFHLFKKEKKSGYGSGESVHCHKLD